MAHDIFFKDNFRDWSRSCDNSTSNSGSIYADEIFNPHRPPRAILSRCIEPQNVVVEKNTSMGWFGYTMAAMFATRILSGKWPWYWAGLARDRLESHTPPSHQKG